MSNQSYVGSVADKQKHEDKCELDESSTIDSGFLSGEVLSEEVSDFIEEKKKVEYSRPAKDSGIIDKEDDLADDLKKPTSMLLDSGVCLSENFSKISISLGFNDLDAPQKEQPVVSTGSFSRKYKDPQPITDSLDIPGKIYYEQNEDGDTHLHMSISSFFNDLTLALIRAAPHPCLLDIPNDDRDTPLHLAVSRGQSQVVRWLIVAGASPCPRDANGDSPLHLAAKTNNYMCVRAIAEPVRQQEKDQMSLKYQGQVYRPCNFDQWNYLGQTCVHIAALYGNAEVLLHLVLCGANVNAKEGCGGYTALHYAVERRDSALVQCLTKCEKIDLETLNYKGRTALEVTRIVPDQILQHLRMRGATSPYISESEDSDDSEDELMYENSHRFGNQMVNASA